MRYLLAVVFLFSVGAEMVAAQGVRESYNDGWSKVQSSLPGHSTAYRRLDRSDNTCGVSLWSDSSGVTLRAVDVNLPGGRVMHQVDVRKIGSKITRTDTWYDSTLTREISPAGDLFIEDCERLLPSLPREMRPFFHEVYMPRDLDPGTTNSWTRLKRDSDWSWWWAELTAVYQNGICSVVLRKDGSVGLRARDTLYHGRSFEQSLTISKDRAILGNVWSLFDHNGGTGRHTSGPNMFLVYCSPVMKYLPSEVRRRIPSPYAEIF